jgi:hypothetical protein
MFFLSFIETPNDMIKEDTHKIFKKMTFPMGRNYNQKHTWED